MVYVRRGVLREANVSADTRLSKILGTIRRSGGMNRSGAYGPRSLGAMSLHRLFLVYAAFRQRRFENSGSPQKALRVFEKINCSPLRLGLYSPHSSSIR